MYIYKYKCTQVSSELHPQDGYLKTGSNSFEIPKPQVRMTSRQRVCIINVHTQQNKQSR